MVPLQCIQAFLWHGMGTARTFEELERLNAPYDYEFILWQV